MTDDTTRPGTVPPLTAEHPPQPVSHRSGSSSSMRFRNPANGHIETVGIGTILLGMLLGPLYYMFQGAWSAVLASVLVGWICPVIGFAAGARMTPAMAIAGAFIGSLFWSTLMAKLIARNYLRRGWVQVSDDHAPAP